MNNKILYIAFVLAMAPALSRAQAQTVADSTAAQQVHVAFGKVNKSDLLGGVNEVNVADLLKKDYHAYSLDGISTMVGGYNGSIWGQSPLVLIDGVPRDASEVDATEVETVTVLKAASAVALYGSRGSKGVVLITTKRGKAQRLTIEARANAGLYVPKRYPHYLGAAEYMSLYNEACDNDGIAHQYSDADIYNTAAGTNPYRYPDMNFYSSDYLRKATLRTDATAEITGGNQRATYYANFGMTYNNGLIKYGGHHKDDNLNFRVRANIDMTITSWLKAFANVGVHINNAYTYRGDFWGAAANLRPNWYSGLLPLDMMDMNNENVSNLVSTSNHIINGKYILGGNTVNQTTLFGDMLAAGYVKDKRRNFLFDVGVNADLGMITPGLSFKSAFSVDYYDYYSEGYKEARTAALPVSLSVLVPITRR